MSDLLDRLRKVESSTQNMGNSVTTNWYRNPDGPEAADEIERLRALLACAYQLAGYYDAPIRFLDAFALHDEYTKMSPDQIIDELLPIADRESSAMTDDELETIYHRVTFVEGGSPIDFARAIAAAERETCAKQVIDVIGRYSTGGDALNEREEMIVRNCAAVVRSQRAVREEVLDIPAFLRRHND